MVETIMATTAGPTRGATEHARPQRWRSHRTAAFVLRAAMFAVPVGCSVAATLVAARVVPRPGGFVDLAVWWILITALSMGILWVATRAMRRFLPLVAMLRLSLVFPDNAPSRFRLALRTGTVKQFQRQLASGTLDTSAQSAAETLLALSARIGNHDRLTRGHSERVRAYADLIGEELKLSRRDRDLLHWSALLHDVGKLEVPAEILNKKGRPTEEEWRILQSHPAAADAYLDPLADWLGDWRLAAREHHERWDGDGYPRGLAGAQISLAGRIVAVADAYDTITSVRSYKKALSPADARAELTRCSGSQFDPTVVRAFLAVSVGRVQRIMNPIAWLAQLPVLATAPTAAVPALTNAVVTTVSAGTVAVATVVTGTTAVPAPRPVAAIEQASDVIEMDAPMSLAFAAFPTPTATPDPSPGPAPAPDPAAGLDGAGTGPTPTPTEGGVVAAPIGLGAGPQPGDPDRGSGVPDSDPAPAPTPFLVIPTPTRTPTPDAAVPPTATPPPTPTPTPRPNGRPTATPTPSPTPTSPPPSAGAVVRYLTNPGDGATDATRLLETSVSPPTTTGSIPNYDADRDNDPGLKLKKDGDPGASNSADEEQLWAVPGTAAVDARVRVTIYAAKQGGGSAATLGLALVWCADDDPTDCTSPVGAGSASVANALSGADSFVGVTVDFGQVSSTAPAGRPLLVLRAVAGARHLHVAYDTAAYPAVISFD